MSSATKAPGAEGDLPDTEQGEKALWYMHIQGPDDVHAAPDFWTGLAWAAELNTAIAEKAAKENWAADGNYPHTQAVVRRWTWSATEHAAMLARELAERQEHAERRAVAMAQRQATKPVPLAEGCCSASSPCAHQKADPNTICGTCQRAAADRDFDEDLMPGGFN